MPLNKIQTRRRCCDIRPELNSKKKKTGLQAVFSTNNRAHTC